jgi:hypothetical protein
MTYSSPHGRCPNRVTGCLPDCVSATAGVRQIAADLLHRLSRQKSGHVQTSRTPFQASPQRV